MLSVYTKIEETVENFVFNPEDARHATCDIFSFVSTHNFYDFELEEARALSTKYGTSPDAQTSLFAFIVMLCSKNYIDECCEKYVAFIDPSLVNKWKETITSVGMHEIAHVVVSVSTKKEELERIKTYIMLAVEQVVYQYAGVFSIADKIKD